MRFLHAPILLDVRAPNDREPLWNPLCGAPPPPRFSALLYVAAPLLAVAGLEGDHRDVHVVAGMFAEMFVILFDGLLAVIATFVRGLLVNLF